ncbi:hypothetical protein PGT21_019273 [Puccinia graminis f. sp. tritici]|uniref:Uncharacterized protein n=1 Tax=Puccinia graminis f. sp. tritici TaxID=56615 RepID=A0A5B0M6T4_PUCGR|nr:hypothetical protein PGT21_018316 [Puccinia graminis f. sp. tritici]KAA1077761.1 hypothetical protein PGT21_019273 [Puccinia graminis f. sp. tritici]KAA1102640.1 hypothetical protein PGTUg99_027244 [Puccinia graminis f. sp. tritici]KAA1125911.1 hypothetical protein PGTUg99_018984 [Puccinia graminis f. sp. tritici]
MKIGIFTIACSFSNVLSYLVFDGISYKSSCVLAPNCKGRGLIVPLNKVRELGFPLEEKCGPYLSGGEKKYCINTRNKLYFQCKRCRTIYCENDGVATSKNGDQDCTAEHYNKEIYQHTKMDLIGDTYGKLRLDPLPEHSSTGS